jgi:hypothetical protein
MGKIYVLKCGTLYLLSYGNSPTVKTKTVTFHGLWLPLVCMGIAADPNKRE